MRSLYTKILYRLIIFGSVFIIMSLGLWFGGSSKLSGDSLAALNESYTNQNRSAQVLGVSTTINSTDEYINNLSLEYIQKVGCNPSYPFIGYINLAGQKVLINNTNIMPDEQKATSCFDTFLAAQEDGYELPAR